MLDLLGPLAKVVPPPPGRATVPPPAGDHEDRVVRGDAGGHEDRVVQDREVTGDAGSADGSRHARVFRGAAARGHDRASWRDAQDRELDRKHDRQSSDWLAACWASDLTPKARFMPSLQHDRPWRQEGIDSESGAAAMDDHSAGGHAQPAASVRASQHSGAVRASEGGAHEDSKRQHLFSHLYRPVSRHSAGETKKLPKARGTDSGTVVSAHQDVVGEKELRDFLTENGFGDRKAYWLSCLQDYKGPRSCKKLSKFLEQCRSIEMYVEGDGKQSIRLAAAFAPAA